MRGEAATPPRKRQRTQREPVKRKRNILSDFMHLPVDLFNVVLAQITSYLSPLDLLHLARSNIFFRNLLMSKSARNIWLSAIKNVEGLPHCPSTMSEPQYVALLFTHVCSICGIASRGEVDEYLLLRLCGTCWNGELMRLHQLPPELHQLVHYSTKGMGVYDHFAELQIHRYVGAAVRDEANAIWDEYNELAEDEDVDEEEFEAWIEQRKHRVARRRKFAGELNKFLCALEAKRHEKKKELIENRRNQIKERLLALGWEEGDLKVNPCSGGRAKEWYNLVDMPKQPKLLTNRTWKNLYAKLLPILEANREERVEFESSQLEARRRECLDRFLRTIKRQEPPLLKVKPRKSNSQWFSSYNRPQVQYDVFPFVQDALDWPIIEALNEDDLSVEELQQALEQHRSEMDTCISEWRDETRTYLADLIREESMEYPELLQPPKNMDPDAYARLTDDQKLLLRADSLFYVDEEFGYTTVQQPYAYDEALRTVSPCYPAYPEEVWDLECYSEPEAPQLDTIHRHTAAQEVARYLLKDLDKPNSSFVEVNQLLYTCERCHDKEPKSWSGMVEHYLEHKYNNTRIKKQASALAQHGITYKNVHVPGDKPMIKPSKPKKPVKVAVRKCILCAKKPISLDIIVSKTKLYQHLLQIHGVTNPRLDIHYHVPSYRGGRDQPGTGYDYEEGDEEMEEVEADNEPHEEAEEIEAEIVYGEGGGSYDEEEEQNEGYAIDDSE